MLWGRLRDGAGPGLKRFKEPQGGTVDEWRFTRLPWQLAESYQTKDAPVGASCLKALHAQCRRRANPGGRHHQR